MGGLKPAISFEAGRRTAHALYYVGKVFGGELEAESAFKPIGFFHIDLTF